ncbi:MAG TPA: FecR family protein [Candidatus Dojkabacteria bacterium]|nr:FecR family protein [Candidatus Dojkabacteria bacterium]
MEKKQKVIVVLLVILGITVLSVLSYFTIKYFSKKPSSEESNNNSNNINNIKTVGKLVAVNSSIYVTREGDEFEIEEEEQDIKVEDVVKTSESGSGYIVFPDNSFLLLDFDSEINVDEISFSDESETVKISLVKGNVWFSLNKTGNKTKDYRIIMSNMVAKAEGTKFGCNIVNEVNTLCYVNEGTIKISDLGKDNFEPFTLSVDQLFDNNSNNYSDDYDPSEHVYNFEFDENNEFLKLQWMDYISCIDEKSEDSDEVSFGLDCKDILISDEYSKPKLPTVIFSKQTNNYKCSWSSIVGDSYKVSISNDIPYAQVNWVETSDTEYFINEGRTISEYYRCNVIPIVNGIEGLQISSELLYVDFAFANIEDVSVTNFSSNTKVTGGGIYRNIEISNLMSRFYIRDKNSDKFFNGTGWQDDEYWFTEELDINGPGLFEIEKSVTFSLDDILGGMQIEYKLEVYNKISQRVLDSRIVDESNPGD